MLTTAPVSRAPGSLRRPGQAVLLSLLLLFPLPCPAQSAQPSPADSGWSVEQWDSSQGLRHGQPQDIITSVVQSPDGYLWIASLRQVWRFDGMRFDELEMPPEIEARISRIFSLRIGAAGELWIATSGAGAVRVEQGSFSVFSSEQGLLSDLVLAVFEDSRGRVWIAPDRGGLHSLDGDHLSTWGEEHGLGGVTIAALMEDSRGRLWAGTWGKGVYLFEHDGFRPFESAMLAGRTVTSMAEDVDGSIWFGTGNGVVRYDPASDATCMVRDLGRGRPLPPGGLRRAARPRAEPLGGDRRRSEPASDRHRSRVGRSDRDPLPRHLGRVALPRPRVQPLGRDPRRRSETPAERRPAPLRPRRRHAERHHPVHLRGRRGARLGGDPARSRPLRGRDPRRRADGCLSRQHRDRGHRWRAGRRRLGRHRRRRPGAARRSASGAQSSHR